MKKSIISLLHFIVFVLFFFILIAEFLLHQSRTLFHPFTTYAVLIFSTITLGFVFMLGLKNRNEPIEPIKKFRLGGNSIGDPFTENFTIGICLLALSFNLYPFKTISFYLMLLISFIFLVIAFIYLIITIKARKKEKRKIMATQEEFKMEKLIRSYSSKSLGFGIVSIALALFGVYIYYNIFLILWFSLLIHIIGILSGIIVFFTKISVNNKEKSMYDDIYEHSGGLGFVGIIGNIMILFVILMFYFFSIVIDPPSGR